MTAREVALLTLGACERRGAWSDGLLKKSIREGGLDRRDAALATKLCLGVLQNKILLDFYLSQYSTMKLEKMELKVRNALRLGIYQMAFLTRVPHSAAVNESVALVRRHCKNPRAAGMVNGILRTVSRNIDRLPVLDARDPVLYLSLRYSHPEWLVRAHCAELGLEETEGLLQWNNSDSPTVAQVNTCKTDVEALTAALLEEGVQAEQHTWLENTLILSDTGDLEELSAFQEGAFYVQGAAARLVVTAAGLQPGMHVLDACAAPGGKSFTAAMDMEDKGEILACDIHSHKKKLIEAGALRLGLQSIKALILDGKKRDEALEERFDAVITDVPCSGLGVIRKKPEIRYKSPEDLEGLPEVQGAILDNVSAYVKPGGVLLYATCTLLRRENEDVVAAFLKGHPEFTLEPFDLPEPVGACREGLITLWPQRHATDGFFIAKLRKA